MQFPVEIRAEILIHLILALDKNDSDVQIIFDGNFKRNYLEDVLKLDKSISPTGEPLYKIYLNKDGIYDKMPEGLFHPVDRFIKFKHSATSKAFKEEYEQQKNEVISARKFFLPVENEMFKKRVAVEKNLIQRLSFPQRSLYDFFFKGTRKFDLSKKLGDHVISFLPAIRHIRGDISKIRFFLMSVLQCKVDIIQQDNLGSFTNISSEQENILGKVSLGMNFYCGKMYLDFLVSWKIIIKTESEKLHKYIGNKELVKFFHFIKSVLVPADVQAEIVIKSEQTNKFILPKKNSKENAMLLGYNIGI